MEAARTIDLTAVEIYQRFAEASYHSPGNESLDRYVLESYRRMVVIQQWYYRVQEDPRHYWEMPR